MRGNSLHNAYIEAMFDTRLHAFVYFVISMVCSTVVQAFALFCHARRGRSSDGEAVLLVGVPLVAGVAFFVRGLYWQRQAAVTLALLMYYAAKALYVRSRSRNRAEQDVQRTFRYSLATAFWCTSLAAPCVLLNLAVDYGYHPGLFRHAEDAWLLGAVGLSVAAAFWSYVSLCWYEGLPEGEQELFTCNRGPWRWSRNPVAACDFCFVWSTFLLCARHVPLYAVLFTLFAAYGVYKDVQCDELARHSKHYKSATYRQWKERTSAIAWIAPDAFKLIPWSVKRAFCFECAAFEQMQLPTSTS